MLKNYFRLLYVDVPFDALAALLSLSDIIHILIFQDYSLLDTLSYFRTNYPTHCFLPITQKVTLT